MRINSEDSGQRTMCGKPERQTEPGRLPPSLELPLLQSEDTYVHTCLHSVNTHACAGQPHSKRLQPL